MPVFGEAGVWPAIIGVVVGALATALVLLARNRPVSRPSTKEDLRCEPGQTLGPALGGGVVKLFRTSEEVSLGTEPLGTTVAIVCSEGHDLAVSPVHSPWSEEAIIVKLPAQGPCHGHLNDVWSFRFDVRPPGKKVLRSGPVYVIDRTRNGYPAFANIPPAPFARREPEDATASKSHTTVVLPDESPATR